MNIQRKFLVAGLRGGVMASFLGLSLNASGLPVLGGELFFCGVFNKYDVGQMAPSVELIGNGGSLTIFNPGPAGVEGCRNINLDKYNILGNSTVLTLIVSDPVTGAILSPTNPAVTIDLQPCMNYLENAPYPIIAINIYGENSTASCGSTAANGNMLSGPLVNGTTCPSMAIASNSYYASPRMYYNFNPNDNNSNGNDGYPPTCLGTLSPQASSRIRHK